MRIEQLLESSARRYSDKIALVSGSTRLTYRELNAAATSLAAALQARALSRGERVILFADNCWEAVVGIFGVMKAGGVVCMVGPSTKEHKLRFVIRDCRATALITKDRLLPTVRGAIEQTSSLKTVIVIGEGDDASARDGILHFSDLLVILARRLGRQESNSTSQC